MSSPPKHNCPLLSSTVSVSQKVWQGTVKSAHHCSMMSGPQLELEEHGSDWPKACSLTWLAVDAGWGVSWAIDYSSYALLSTWPGLACNMMADFQRQVSSDRERETATKRYRERDWETERQKETEMRKGGSILVLPWVRRYMASLPLYVIGQDGHKGKEHRPNLQWEECRPHYKKSMWDEINVLEGIFLKNIICHY